MVVCVRPAVLLLLALCINGVFLGPVPPCDGLTILSGPSGSFGTGDGGYGEHADCRWQIDCGTGNRCLISFDEFYLDQRVQVRVYDGLTSSDTEIVTLRSGPAPDGARHVATSRQHALVILRAFGYSFKASGFPWPHTASMSWSIMPPSVCGDAIVDRITEVCDDGNTISGDGCASDCLLVEPGYTCTINGGPCASDTCGGANAVDPVDWPVLTFHFNELGQTIDPCGGSYYLSDEKHRDAWFKLDPGVGCPPGFSYDKLVGSSATTDQYDHSFETSCPVGSHLECPFRRSDDVTYMVISKLNRGVAWVSLASPPCVAAYIPLPGEIPHVFAIAAAFAVVFAAVIISSARTSMRAAMSKVLLDNTAGVMGTGGLDRASKRSLTVHHEAVATEEPVAGKDEQGADPDESKDEHGAEYLALSKDATVARHEEPSLLIRGSNLDDDQKALLANCKHQHDGTVRMVVQAFGYHKTSCNVLVAPNTMTLKEADVFFRARLQEAVDRKRFQVLEIEVQHNDGWSGALPLVPEKSNAVWRAAMDHAVSTEGIMAVRVYAQSADAFPVLTAVIAVADWTTDVILVATLVYMWILGDASVFAGPTALGVASLIISTGFGAVHSSRVLRAMLRDDPQFRDSVQSMRHGSLALAVLTLLGACHLETLRIIGVRAPFLGLGFRMRSASRVRLTTALRFTAVLEDVPMFVAHVWLIVTFPRVFNFTSVHIVAFSTTLVMLGVFARRLFSSRRDARQLKFDVTRSDREVDASVTNLPVSVKDVLAAKAAALEQQDEAAGEGKVRIVGFLWGKHPSTAVCVDVALHASMLDIRRQVLPRRPLCACVGGEAEQVTAHGVEHEDQVSFMVSSCDDSSGGGSGAAWVSVEDDRRYWSWRLAKAAETPDRPLVVMIIRPRHWLRRIASQAFGNILALYWWVLFTVTLIANDAGYILDPLWHWSLALAPLELGYCTLVYIVLRRFFPLANGGTVNRALRHLDITSIVIAVVIPTHLLERVVHRVRRAAPLAEKQQLFFLALRALHPHVILALLTTRVVLMGAKSPLGFIPPIFILAHLLIGGVFVALQLLEVSCARCRR